MSRLALCAVITLALLLTFLPAQPEASQAVQSEVAALRSTLRRGAPLDDAPVPPAEAANDEAPSKGKRVKGAENP